MDYTMHGPPSDCGLNISAERAAVSTARKLHYGCTGRQAWYAADIAWLPAWPPGTAGTVPASSGHPPQAQSGEALILLLFLASVRAVLRCGHLAFLGLGSFRNPLGVVRRKASGL